LIPQGDDEVECLDEGRRALSCHADQGKVNIYRVKMVQSMCEAGDDILPCLRLALTCNKDVAAFAVPDFDEGSETLDFSKFRICGIAYLTNCQAQKQAIVFFASPLSIMDASGGEEDGGVMLPRAASDTPPANTFHKRPMTGETVGVGERESGVETRGSGSCARTSAEGAIARSAGARATARTSAKGADARSAGAGASARTGAKGADARSAGAGASANTSASGASARSAGA